MLSEFWVGIRTEFPTVSESVLNIFLLSCTMFICKVALMVVKSKYQSTLKKIEESLGLTVSNTQVRMDLYVQISSATQHSHALAGKFGFCL